MADDDKDAPAKDADDKGDDKPDEKDDLGDAGKKALERERKARRDAEAKIKELEPFAAKAKELEEASATEVEKLTKRLAESEERASKAENERDRFSVALDKGLSKTQAKRLVGTNAEEFTADADELLADLGTTEKTPTPKPDRTQGAKGDPVEETDPAKLAAMVPRDGWA